LCLGLGPATLVVPRRGGPCQARRAGVLWLPALSLSWRPRMSVLVRIVILAPAGAARAQQTPRPGGELVFVVPAEPPSFDGHREETFAMLHPVAPSYNTLIRVDPNDRTGT